MKLILQGPPASGKTTLARMIMGDKEARLAHLTLESLDGALQACKAKNYVAFLDNWSMKLDLDLDMLRLLEQAECDVIITTCSKTVPSTSIPVFTLAQVTPSERKSEAVLLGLGR